MIPALIGAAASGAVAQQQGGGTVSYFGLSSTLRADDNWDLVPNPPNSSFQLSNQLTAGISSTTRTSSATVDVGATIHSSDIAGNPAQSGIIDPFAKFGYTTGDQTSTFSVNGGYAETDQNAARAAGLGTRTDTDLGAGYSFGQGLPFSGNVDLDFSVEDYRNSPDPADVRAETLRFATSFAIAVSPRMAILPSASITEYAAEDVAMTETTTSNVGLGVRADISSALSVTAKVAQTNIDSSVSGTSRGTVWSVALAASVPNGSHTVGVNQDISTAGRRTGVAYSRAWDGAEGTVTAGIGLTESAAGATEITANASFSQTTAVSSATLALDRNFVTNPSGTESLLTSLSASYSRNVSSTNSVAFAVVYNQDTVTGGTDDVSATASVTYNFTVTNDWMGRAGYERRYSDDASGEAHSNSIFVGLDRRWVSSR